MVSLGIVDIRGVRADDAVVELLRGIDRDGACRLDNRLGNNTPRGRYDIGAGLDKVADTGHDLSYGHVTRAVVCRSWVVVLVELVTAADEGVVETTITGIHRRIQMAHLPSRSTGVVQDISVDKDVFCRRYRAVEVVEGLTAHCQIPPCVNKRRGRTAGYHIFIALYRGETERAAFTLAEIVGVDVDVARYQFLFCTELIAAVTQAARQQTHIADAFQGAGNIFDQGTAAVRVVPCDIKVTQAVDIAEAVAEVIDPHRHVVAAENQALVVAQVSSVQPHLFGTTQGAVVVQFTGVDRQVACRCQAAMVVQGRAVDVGSGATGNPGGVAQVHAGAGKVHVAQTADATVAAVVTGKGQLKATVTGQETFVDPGVTFAAQTLRAQQLTAGCLSELTDIKVQATGLDDTAVGPARRLDIQLAIGHEAAARAGDLI